MKKLCILLFALSFLPNTALAQEDACEQIPPGYTPAACIFYVDVAYQTCTSLISNIPVEQICKSQCSRFKPKTFAHTACMSACRKIVVVKAENFCSDAYQSGVEACSQIGDFLSSCVVSVSNALSLQESGNVSVVLPGSESETVIESAMMESLEELSIPVSEDSSFEQLPNSDLVPSELPNSDADISDEQNQYEDEVPLP